MATYTDRLNLDSDPFGADRSEEDFYGGGNRQELLDQLIEQCSSSAELVVLTGPLGAGKTRLGHILVQSLDDTLVPVQIQAALFMSPEQLLEEICRKLDLEVAAEATAADLSQQLDEYLESLGARSRVLLLVIDDAHELGTEALQRVLELLDRQSQGLALSEDSPRAVLLGEASLLSSIAQLVPQSPVSFQLEHLNVKETADYIRFKLAGAGYRGKLPLSSDKLNTIHSRSGGVPGAIDVLADESLRQGGSLNYSTPKFGFLERHLVPVSAAFGVLVLVLFFTLGEDSAPGTDLANPARTMNSNSAVSAVSTQGQRRIEVPVSIARADSATAPASAGQSPAAESVAPVREVAAPESAGPQEAGPAVITSEKAAPATPVSAALLASPAAHYTLQLLGSHSQENVQRFIQSSGNASEMRYFESRFQDKPWYVVVYGEFPDREAAREALAQLPGNLRDLQPWARSLGDIQADIRDNQ